MIEERTVKVRGFRIESGEVEMAIRQHPAIHDCTVIAHESTFGQNQLIAYVVAEPGDKISSKLRSFLRERLPDYMLPVAFIKLASIPRLVNNKIDYLALPSPDLAAPESLPDRPRTPTEEALAEIWADVLEMERVGIHENFFELGGHSLQAIRLISRVNHTLLQNLSLRALFEGPTIADLASTIDVNRKASVGLTGLETTALLPVPRENYLPLSFAQQRLWFLSRWTSEDSLYNLPLVLRLSGRLDRFALAQSLHELVCRHEILRTTFSVVDGQPAQVIAPPPTAWPMPIVDIQTLPIQEREREALRLTNEEAWRPFDLSSGPLVRTTLLYVSTTEAWLLLTQHHSISDDWSLNILVQEIVECYRAFSMGDAPQLPHMSLHYADFACWQRTWLQGETLEKQFMYWRKQLAGSPHALELPTDHPRPALQTFEGSVCSITLPFRLVGDLKASSRKEGTTLFMTLLAAFNTLLYRYTGQDDIVVGTPIANRTQIEFERIPGLFLNTLLLRSNLSGDSQFQELLRQTREVVLEAYAHQDLPFEKLVEELQSERDLSRNALFQALFVLQPAPASLPVLPQLTIEFVDIESNTAKLDLTLTVKEEHGSMTAALEYNTVLFDRETITRMLDHFHILLESITAHPAQHLSALPLLTEEELQQVLYTWNATQTTFPGEQCLHQLFEAQVSRTPDAIALTCAGQHITYTQLNRCANRLARQLRELGVDAETLVVLLLERGIDFIISILAIFKAGGAFLPLDVQHPSQRHAQIFQQSGCTLVLTREKYGADLREVLSQGSVPQSVQVVSIGALEGVGGQSITAGTGHLMQLESGEPAEENLVAYNSSKNLAYAMYTSGSTGIPKGVMVEHVGMINHMCAKIKDLGITARDNVAQNGPPCFDIVVWQCLAALIVGGRVTIFQDEITYHPARFLQHVAHEGVTVLQAVPSLLRILVQQATTLGERRPMLDQLRWVVPTGDALPSELCRQWLQLYPTIPLLNTYGSTECSDDQCHSAISVAPSPPYDTPIMPIGQPIQNMSAYVLDHYLLPVPIGVVGDLYIGGIGVGRGYLHDPARTAEVFLPDPFAQEPSVRMYKTRDRARYLANGQLAFIGRSDHLVKIHGMRIEPGEIEITLERHSAVQEAVVSVRETRNGERYLAAYVIARHHQKALANELREWLRERLPEYMVPTAVVFLDRMPLNSNGKVDRRALPDPGNQQEDNQKVYMPPTTEVEQIIVSVWQDVLGIEKVGLHDNFFALGGHSLLMAQVQSKLQELLRREIAIVDLFRHPTAAALARYVEQPIDGQQELALSNIQERVKKQKEALKRRKRSNP